MKSLLPIFYFLWPACALAGGFSEPPAVLYGKVIHVGGGATHQVSKGTLSITLTSDAQPPHSVTFSDALRPSGSSGAFSYRIAVPQDYLPAAGGAASSVPIGSNPVRYRFTSVTVDGVPAVPLDVAQSLFQTSFDRRAQEHRLDLKVALQQQDRDADGMPDWWEDLHGLNPLDPSDATTDLDTDGINNLAEFRGATDPNVSNATPTVLTGSVLAPVGGVAGLFLPVVDANAPTPGALRFTVTSATGVSVTPSGNFTYQDMLDGGVSVRLSGAATGTLVLALADSANVAEGSVPVTVKVEPFSPAGLGAKVWLEPRELAARYPGGGAVSAWGGHASGALVAFQTVTANQPQYSGSGGAVFAGDDFLYLNDSALSLREFTALAVFDVRAVGREDATLLDGRELGISVGGTGQAAYAQCLKVRRDGQSIFGPPVALGRDLQISVSGDAAGSMLAVEGTARYSSQRGAPLSPAFAALGGRRGITEAAASNFLDGGIKEFILFGEKLDPGSLSRLEDYQLSRWRSTLVWDYRKETVPLRLTGKPGVRNSLNGGWGRDTLNGGTQDDTLRGGPSADLLSGNRGADRFQFFPGDGADTVTDFSEAEGDIIDLSPIFGGKGGLPTTYLSLDQQVSFPSGQAPVASTLLKLDYDGDGGAPDQVITLRGVVLTAADLPRLTGSGSLYLGGPRFPVAVALNASETNLTETEVARTITLTRSGDTSGSADVYLSFVGTAQADVDYKLANATNSGAVRRVTFPAGAKQVQVALTPIQDVLPETEAIDIAVLPSALFPEASAALSLNLADAPEVRIESLVGYAQRLGAVPGVVRVSRTGDLARPLDVRLSLDGTALNGDDYEQVAPLVSFGAGEGSRLLEIMPASHARDPGQPKVAIASVVPDTTRYATLDPWSASVTILDQLGGGPHEYASWRAALSPPYNSEAAFTGDGDPIPLFTEYVVGLDPTAQDGPTSAQVNAFSLDGRFVMEFPTRAGLSDIRLAPEILSLSGSTANWIDKTDAFDHRLYPLGNDRVMHVFTSRRSVTEFSAGGVYRVRSTPVAVLNRASSLGTLLGSGNRRFRSAGASGWTPSVTGTSLSAAPRPSGQTSVLETDITGAATVSFSWAAEAGSGATLEFRVDGALVSSLSSGSPSATVNHAVSGAGAHRLQWTVRYGTATGSGLVRHAGLSNLSITP